MASNLKAVTTIYDVGPDQVSYILGYLTTLELMTARSVDKKIFGGAITVVVREKMRNAFGVELESDSKAVPIALLELETNALLTALRSPYPTTGGHWISTQWINIAQTYYKSMHLRIQELKEHYNKLSNNIHCKLKKKAKEKVSKKQTSKLLPVERPNLRINSDIICPHGNLSVNKNGSRAQRRLISQQSWKAITTLHNPSEQRLDILTASECKFCLENKSENLQNSIQSREQEKLLRLSKIDPDLMHLLNRKNGVPWRHQNLTLSILASEHAAVDFANYMTETINSESSTGTPTTPLISYAYGIGNENDSKSQSISSNSSASDSNDNNNSKSHVYNSNSCGNSNSSSNSNSSIYVDNGNSINDSNNASSVISDVKASDFFYEDEREKFGLKGGSILTASVTTVEDPREKLDFFNSIDSEISKNTSSAFIIPPGTYAVMPHYWLQSWRHYIRDPSVTYFSRFDGSYCRCIKHKKIVIPTHLEDYLVGIRPKLLRPLPIDRDLVVELISIREFELLLNYILLNCNSTSETTLCPKITFFGENLTWSGDACTKCDSKSALF